MAIRCDAQSLKKVVAQDPNVLDAWVMLGNEYFRQADSKARRSLQAGAQINPSNLAIVNLAGAYHAMR